MIVFLILTDTGNFEIFCTGESHSDYMTTISFRPIAFSILSVWKHSKPPEIALCIGSHKFRCSFGSSLLNITP
jgi:hypothetical protein